MAVKRVKRTIKRAKGYELIPIIQAFEDYIVEKEARNLSDATIKSYRETINVFMRFAELDNESTTDMLEQTMLFRWINEMRDNEITPASINHYLRDIRAFFYWCMEEPREYIKPKFQVKMVEKQEEKLKLFVDEDLEALLVKPKKNDAFVNWRTWAIVNWVLATGNRASTIVDIKLNDIDYNRREIILTHTKNKKAQIIPLSTSLEIAIKEYIRMWRSDADNDAYLFCNVGEEQLTTNGLRHAFRRYCLDRDVSSTNIHGLRHNFAKGWVQNNGNMFALQKILGHSTLDMTRKYVRLYNEDIKTDYDEYNPLDTIKKNKSRKQLVKRCDR